MRRASVAIFGDNGRVWRFAVVVALAGCGRIGFGALDRGSAADGGPSSGDGARPGDGIPSSQLCGGSGAIFCDDFESGDLSKWTGSATCSNCTVVASEQYVHAGNYALLGDTTGGASVADTAEAFVTFSPRATGMLAARVWADPVQVASENAGVLELEAGAGDTTHAIIINMSDLRLWQVAELANTNEDDNESSAVPSQGTWTCLEVDVQLESPAQIALYVDDAQVLTFAGNDPSASFAALYVGAQRATDSGAVDAIDDVVLATQHVGCN
jgi:hypothetical protein